MYNSILNFIHNFKLKATYTRQSQVKCFKSSVNNLNSIFQKQIKSSFPWINQLEPVNTFEI